VGIEFANPAGTVVKTVFQGSSEAAVDDTRFGGLGGDPSGAARVSIISTRASGSASKILSSEASSSPSENGLESGDGDDWGTSSRL